MVEHQAGDDRAGLHAAYALELRREGLPVREDLDGILEVATQQAMAHIVGQDAAGVNSGHGEVEAVTVIRDAISALDEGAVFECLMR